MHGDTALADHGERDLAGSDPALPAAIESHTSAASRRLAVVGGLGIAVALILDAAPTGGPSSTLSTAPAYRRLHQSWRSEPRRRWNLLIAAALVAIGSDGLMLVSRRGAAPVVRTGLDGPTRPHHRRRRRRSGRLGCAPAVLAGVALRERPLLLAALAMIPLWISGYRIARTATRQVDPQRLGRPGATPRAGMVAGGASPSTQRSALLRAADATVDAAERSSPGRRATARGLHRERERVPISRPTTAGAWWASRHGSCPWSRRTSERSTWPPRRSGAERRAASWPAQWTTTAPREDGSVDLALLAEFRGPVEQAAMRRRDSGTGWPRRTSPWLAAAGRVASSTSSANRSTGVRRDRDRRISDRHLPASWAPTVLGAICCCWATPPRPATSAATWATGPRSSSTTASSTSSGSGSPTSCSAPAPNRRRSCPRHGAPAVAGRDRPDTLPPELGSASPTSIRSPELAADLYPQAAGGAPIDGVIYADPVAFAALLELTGPVEAEGRTGLRQRGAVPDARPVPAGRGGDAVDVDLIRAALDRLTDNQLPASPRSAEAFGDRDRPGPPPVRDHRRTGEPSCCRTVGMDQPVPTPEGGDFVAVLSRNANPSKIDAYLQRHRLRRDVGPRRPAPCESRVVVTLRNHAPAAGLPLLVNGHRLPTPGRDEPDPALVLSPLRCRRRDGRWRRPAVRQLARISMTCAATRCRGPAARAASEPSCSISRASGCRTLVPAALVQPAAAAPRLLAAHRAAGGHNVRRTGLTRDGSIVGDRRVEDVAVRSTRRGRDG